MESDLEATARILGALAHPARLRILDLLCERETCVCELVAALQQRQAYVSQQLAVLRQAGLVIDRRDGLKIFYRLSDHALVALLREAARLSSRLQVAVSAAPS